MPLSINTQRKIEAILIGSLRNKFENHNPEPAFMPFHTRLLGKDRLALYSFIHSLNTNFGTTIFEPVAIEIAKQNFSIAQSQVIAGNTISEKSLFVIQRIMDDLISATTDPNKSHEVSLIREHCRQGSIRTVKPTNVDIKLVDNNGNIFLIDLKTAKPNRGGFKEFKRTLLEWVAVTLYENPHAEVSSLIAIPYNPYEPKPYSRWTMKGMLDLGSELKVASEFWNFLGGEGTYEILLHCFENVGIELKEEIDTYFESY